MAITYAFIGDVTPSRSGAVHTAAGASIGTASATRRVYVFIASSTFRDLDSATIAGETATIHSWNRASDGCWGVFSAIVTTGTTGDIVATMNGTEFVNARFLTYTVDDSTIDATTFQTGFNSANGDTLSIDYTGIADGLMLSSIGWGNGSGKTPITISLGTRDVENNIMSAGSLNGDTAGARTATWDWSGTFVGAGGVICIAADASSVSDTDIIVQESSHAHTADNVVLTTSTTLTVDSALHGHTADNVTLGVTTATTLTVADSLHAHTADNITLNTADTITLTVAGSLHSHTVDNVALTSSTALIVDDSLHSHTSDNVALTTSTTLNVNDALHAHTADNLTLQIAGETTLSNLDAVNGHFADNVVLTSNTSIVVDSSLHAHTVDNIVLSTGDAINLVVADSVHGMFADNVDLTLETFLAIASARHDHFADSVQLTSDSTLQVNDALHAHFADNVAVSIRADEKFPLAGIIQQRPITTAQQYPLSGITQE